MYFGKFLYVLTVLKVLRIIRESFFFLFVNLLETKNLRIIRAFWKFKVLSLYRDSKEKRFECF